MMNLADIEHAQAAHKANINANEALALRIRHQDGAALEPSTFGRVIMARLAGYIGANSGPRPELRRADST